MELKCAIEKFTEWRTLKIKSHSLRSYDKDLKYFAVYCDKRLRDIEIMDIVEYMRRLEHLGWSVPSIIQKSIALRKFFEFYKLQGFKVIEPNLIQLPIRRATMPRVASQKDYHTLCATISKDPSISRSRRNLAIVKMLYCTGARNGEICSLKLSDCDFKRKRAVIRTEKARSKPFREIFWNVETQRVLDRWIKIRQFVPPKEDNVFVCLDKRKRGKALTRNGISDMMRNWSRIAGIETMNPHSFRHRFGRDCAKKGLNNSSISTLLGHNDIRSSYIYTQIEGEELQQEWEKVRS